MPAVMETTHRSFAQKQEEASAPSVSLSPEWEAEIGKRLKEVENGTVVLEPFDQTLRRAYERLASIHASKMALA